MSFTVDFETSLESLADRLIMRLKFRARCRLTHLCPSYRGSDGGVVLGWSRNSRSSWGSLRTFGSISPDRFCSSLASRRDIMSLGKHRATLDSHRYSYRNCCVRRQAIGTGSALSAEDREGKCIARCGQATVSLAAELARLFYRYLEFRPNHGTPGLGLDIEEELVVSRLAKGTLGRMCGAWVFCFDFRLRRSHRSGSRSGFSRLLSLPQFSFVNFS